MTSATSAWSASGSRKSRSSRPRSRTEPTNALTSAESGSRTTGRLGDAVRLQPVDGLADLLVGAEVTSAGSPPGFADRTSSTAGLLGAFDEAVLEHPRVAVQLRQVVPAGVGEQHDDHGVIGELAGDRQGGDHGRAGRAADQDALLPGDGAGGEQRVAVRHPHPPVDHLRVEGLRPEVLADALGEVRAGLFAGPAEYSEPSGSAPTTMIVRVPFLQVPRGAGDRPAGADAADEHVDPPVGLLPDLGAGRLVVRRGVLVVEVLVRLERAGDLLGQPVGDAVVATPATPGATAVGVMTTSAPYA